MEMQELLGKLENVKKQNGSYQAICPAHEDKRASLTLSEKDKKILIYCHAGCEPPDILGAIGLQVQNLFSSNGNGNKNEPLAVFDYRDETGKLLYQTLRYPDKKFVARQPNGTGFDYNLEGVERVPYNLQGVIRAAKAGETIFIVEGEKDANRLNSLGLVATTNSGGAGKWTDSLSAYFVGANVAILPDNDKPGREHALKVAESLLGKAESVKIISLPGLPEKGDVSDWLDDWNTVAELETIVNATEKTLTIDELRNTSSWENLNVNVNVNSIHTNVNVNIFETALIDFPLVKMAYLVEGFIPSGSISMVYGDGGQGKSYLALTLACSIVSGLPFLGKPVRKGRVLYLDFELSPQVQRKRLEGLQKGLKLNKEALMNLIYAAPGNQENIPVSLYENIALLKDNNFDLIILDSIGASLQGDAESAKDICKLFQALRPLGTVLVLDHQPKTQRGDKARDKTPFGSAYKTNLSRNVWHLNKSSVSGENTLNCLLRNIKNNFASLGEDMAFNFIFNEGAISLEACEAGLEFYEHLSIKQKILLKLEELSGATAEDLAKDIGESLESVKPNLTALKKRGKIVAMGQDGRASIYAMSANVNNSATLHNVNVNDKSFTSSEALNENPENGALTIKLTQNLSAGIQKTDSGYYCGSCKGSTVWQHPKTDIIICSTCHPNPFEPEALPLDDNGGF